MKNFTTLFFVLLVFITSQAQNQTINGNLHLTVGSGGTLRIGKTGDGGNIAVPVGSITGQYNIDFSGYRDMSPDQIGARISAIRYNIHSQDKAYVQNTALTFYTNVSGLNPGTTDLAERMRITPGGYVGIGTTNPTSKLDVEGTGSISNLLNVGKQIHPSNGGIVNRISITPYRHTGGPWYFTSRDTPSIAYLDIMYGEKKLFSMIHTGGIDVAGPIKAREVTIEITAGADHVFNNEYDLKPLLDVEQFIQENKHLAEVPSEKQMQAEGLNVNEFQIKLLQKIEELTLYVIQQEKKNLELEQKIETLQTALFNKQ